jgi:hypothetical protein
MDEFRLPEDPRPGQILEIPEGREEENRSEVLSLYQGTVCVGFTEGLDKVLNISGAAELQRSVLSKELKVGEPLEVRKEVLPIDAYEFVNFFGWQAHRYRDNPSTPWSQHYEIKYLAQIPHNHSVQFVYERICLQAVEGDNDDAADGS